MNLPNSSIFLNLNLGSYYYRVKDHHTCWRDGSADASLNIRLKLWVSPITRFVFSGADVASKGLCCSLVLLAGV